MPIKFTKHALERLNSRGLSRKLIIDIMNNHDSLQKDKFGNFIAQKKKGAYLYYIVCFTLLKVRIELSLLRIKHPKLISIR